LALSGSIETAPDTASRHVKLGRVIPIAAAFSAAPIQTIPMSGEGRTGKDQGKAPIGIGDLGHDAVDPGIRAGDKRLLN
jgi:hypothetical protein